MMARFLALYIGSASNDKQTNQPSAAIQETGMAAWAQWATEHQASILDGGAPLGKTLKVDQSGISRTTNRVTGYVIIEAESHERAGAIFRSHPHFEIFSASNSVEIIEILALPTG